MSRVAAGYVRSSRHRRAVVDDELLERRADDREPSGFLAIGTVDRLAARRRAPRRRPSRSGRWCSPGAFQDVRFALRSLRATPTVTAVAVLSLALGIGANAAIFSIINSLLLRMLPVQDPARLVLITDTPTRARSWGYPIWLEIHERQHLFEDSAAWSFTRFDLSSGGETQFVDGLWVSGSFFETLGVKAALGRTLSARDDQRNSGADGPVAVISDGFWRRHFNGAQDVVGRILRLDGADFTIVGVLPPRILRPRGRPNIRCRRAAGRRTPQSR